MGMVDGSCVLYTPARVYIPLPPHPCNLVDQSLNFNLAKRPKTV